jgi:hypothetical protein
VDSSGNVGIGTTSPAYPLQVRRAGGAGSLGVTVDSVGAIARAIQYYAVGDTTSVATGHAWYYRPSTATDTLGMVLNGDGNLGLGTASPAYRLHVVGATTSISAFRRTTADDTQILVGNTAGDLQIRALANGNGLIYSDTGKTLGFGSNGSGTAQITLDTSGNLGIGAASPTALLDVNADTMRLRTARTPASATAAGNAGDICWDATYLYICTATNTWRRILHATW